MIILFCSKATIQNFIRNQAKQNKRIYSLDDKKALVERIENKSKREVEGLLAKIDPSSVTKDKERVITSTQTEIRFTADVALLKKLKRIKGLWAHKNSNPNYNELLNMMADYVLAKEDPEVRADKTRSKGKVTSPEKPGLEKNKISRYLPQSIKNEVIKRDGWQCGYVDKDTGKRCGSTFGLEFNHKKEFSLGGKSVAENLELLCRCHNQLKAIKTFGENKMRKYIDIL